MSSKRKDTVSVEYLLMAGCDAPLPPGVDELVCGEMVHILARNIVAAAHAKNKEALRDWKWACVRCARKAAYKKTHTPDDDDDARIGGAHVSVRECSVVIDAVTGRGTSECGVRHVYELGQVSWVTVSSFPVGSVRESNNQRRA